MKSMIVEVSASMSVTRRRVDYFLTSVMWVGWLSLLLPAFKMLDDADADATPFGVRVADEGFTALDYAPWFVGGIVLVVSIIGLWSFYNQRCNRRVARGGHLGWLGARRVADFYAVDLCQLFSWQHSRRLIVTHDDGGSVHHVEVDGKPLITTVIPKREHAPLDAANEEPARIVVAVGNVIPLLLPMPTQSTSRQSPDQRATRLTYNGRVYYT